jgi:hypothetical protein
LHEGRLGDRQQEAQREAQVGSIQSRWSAGITRRTKRLVKARANARPKDEVNKYKQKYKQTNPDL